MDDLERKHYTWLKEKYDFLVKIIMGSNYYTNSIHVFDADIEVFKDMERKIVRLKNDLKMYKILFFCMTIFILIFGIYSIIK